MTSLKNINFIAYNNKKKALYELTEYIYYLTEFRIITIAQLNDLKNFIKNLNENQLISNHPHCMIKRTHPIVENINNVFIKN